MSRIDELEKGLVDCNGEQVLAELIDGKEHGDPIPKAPPVGISRQLSTSEQMRMMIQREISQLADADGFETFEEAEDFDIDDDPLDPHTPYEAVFDPPPMKEKEDGGSTSVTSVDEGRADTVVGGASKSDSIEQDVADTGDAAPPQKRVPRADQGARGAQGEGR